MRIIKKFGREDIAIVYIAEMDDGCLIEFVESLQPPIPRKKKWVLIVSTLRGCVVGCPMCDAGSWYRGKLSAKDILAQIDYMVKNRFSSRSVPVEKFKIQFSRMGEPSFNPAVIELLKQLPEIYDAPGLMPCISTVAPLGREDFFSVLLDAKNCYARGKFQLQFSMHSTDDKLRDKFIPIKKWNFEKIAQYGEKFCRPGDRKITLNFALAEDFVLDAKVLKRYFNPETFLVKITPVNPTLNAMKNGINSYFIESKLDDKFGIIEQLESFGFEVILSIGELGENKIGSNCGQFVGKFLDKNSQIQK